MYFGMILKILTVVKAVKPDFIQKLLQQGKRDLSIELGSIPL